MKLKITLAILGLFLLGMGALHFIPDPEGPKAALPTKPFPAPDREAMGPAPVAAGSDTETATFGSGCFWCTEAVFQQLKGVRTVVSGYSGGTVPNPTYDQVCSGKTGHAEAVQIVFDPKVVTYPELLEVFWRTHDPTTVNRQGNDHGSQYRSVIFYHSDRQRLLAEQYRRRIDEAQVFSTPVVTVIVPFAAFYPAEEYHQNFYATHPEQSYCRTMIGPKLEKLRKVFHEKMKE